MKDSSAPVSMLGSKKGLALSLTLLREESVRMGWINVVEDGEAYGGSIEVSGYRMKLVGGMERKEERGNTKTHGGKDRSRLVKRIFAGHSPDLRSCLLELC
jgi:hypothetical protein